MEEGDMEFNLVSNPHPHPLIFYRRGKPVGQKILCSKCSEFFRPPAFACSDDNCSFNIHQSCIHLPNEICSPFHSHDPKIQTPLLLTTTNNNHCTCCSHTLYDASYMCTKRCGFTMDVQCAIANPKSSSLLKTASGEFRHFSHLHPLTLHLETDPVRGNTIPVCLVCKRPIKSPSTYYFCSQSLSLCHSYTFHQHCAELPRQIFNPHIHPDHPLLLLAQQPFSCICACCKTECEKFFYSCSHCDFNLHVYCISSFKHKHDFRIFGYELTYNCKLCHISNKGIPWLCIVCHQLAHEKCAIRQMSQDQLHPSSSNQISNINDPILENLDNNRIQHLSHEKHELTLCRPHEDMHCDGCMQHISSMSESYACPPCGFYLHKQCAKLPTQLNNSFLHSHELSMVYIPDFVFSCALCLQYCHGFAYRCHECGYVIDIRCAVIAYPFKHPSHHHHLTNYDGKVECECKACGGNLGYKKVIGCEGCSFYLDVRCAHLPLVVINRFDEHPLILAFEKDSDEEETKEGVGYYCDVCEEERNENEWFYRCWKCCFAAHTKCVLGDYPFLKSAKFKNHQHPLTLVDECKKRQFSRSCDVCANSCAGKLAFECGNLNCKFNVHAFGQCYHDQLTQAQITFTMPSLRYRSFPLHPNEKWKLSSSSNMNAKVKVECSPTFTFVSQGNWYGQHWDDGVFSSIRAFRINMFYRVIGIQMEYEDKNGNSIWKEKHGRSYNYYNNQTPLAEVTLNHPDEYLTSIHGCYTGQGIHSLTFETNQRTLGPYEGTNLNRLELMTKFSFPTTRGLKIVGLHGRSDINRILHAIGFHFVEI